jgi:Zn-dependent protease
MTSFSGIQGILGNELNIESARVSRHMGAALSSASVFFQLFFDDQRTFFAVVITVVFSICIHELAHGITAIWYGDRTPIEQGHMTLNPAVHMGGFSIVLLLLAGIAWGAMPVDERRMRGQFAPAVVAFAGPLSNFILAAIALIAVGLWQRFDDTPSSAMSVQMENVRYLLIVFGRTNIALGLFNLIPIPPLDGSRILGNFSRSYAETVQTLMASGGAIVLFLFVFMGASKLIWPAADAVMVWTVQQVRGY